MKARFPIGMTFERKRYPMAKENTVYTIEDIILHVSTRTGETFKIEYLVSHEFMGQKLTERVVDTAIARSLSYEELQKYI